LTPQIQEVTDGHSLPRQTFVIDVGVGNPNEAARFGKRKRAKQNSPNNAEDRGAGANA
jgi:hypothetical protein